MNTGALDTLLLADKEFYSIGEISQMLGIKPYVLRYWESQFGALRPARRNSGQRKFTRRDVEIIFKIRELLYDRRYTIEGAKKFLKNRDKEDAHPAAPGGAPAPAGAQSALREIKEGLSEVIGLLRSHADAGVN